MNIENIINNINENNPIQTISFDLNIKPEAYKRPRTSFKLKKNKFYNPNMIYINKLKKLIKTQLPTNFEIIKGEISIDLLFIIEPPKTIKNSKLKLDLINKFNLFHPISRPDLDNYIKPVLDSMNNFVYYDDGLIYKINAEKQYINDLYKEPKIEIKINYRMNKIKLR